ncbi:uncharacterized protein PF3D7_1120000-like [Palaemon carinicauda]|uniref:uncharacterized protein PF3D7_1120000-like n=1 Tax=Palaemon carinicauda TaxID=392227 RepID=UPI0035B69ABC
MEEKVEGGPPEEKNQKREELKEKENVQKTFEERIGFLQKELEAAFAEISLRKEEQSKFLEENEELRAENQHLSNIIGSLQIDNQIDMENLTTKNADLDRTNEHLKKEICNQKVILEQCKNELKEKEKENIKLKQKLDKVRQNKRKLEIFTEKKMEVIKQISEQKQELEESLNEAKINDLLRNERYKGILQELENYKKENLKLNDLEQKNILLSQELETFKSEKNVGLKDELLAANEIIPSFKEELEEGDKTKEENKPQMTKLRLNKTSLKMDIKDVQKDVQKDDRDNKSEEKVVEAQDQDTNGRKAEKEEVGGASGVGQPKRAISSSDSSHITFQGEKVRVTTTRDSGLNRYVTVDLHVPRRFHRAIYGVEGRTLMEITRHSGVSLIDMPQRHEYSHSITISGTIKQVQLAADHIEWLLKSLTGT